MKRLSVCATALLFLALAATFPGAAQQQTGKLPIIGWLRVAAAERVPGQPLRDALAARGLVDGQNMRLEVRLAEGKVERFPELAQALVRDGPAIIVAFGPDAARAAQAATTTIPIVAVTSFVEEGLVANMARPVGNLTGVSILVNEIDPKKLEVLKELIPDATHIAVLNDASTRVPERPRAMAEAAAKLGVRLLPRGFEDGFAFHWNAEAKMAIETSKPTMPTLQRRRVIRGRRGAQSARPGGNSSPSAS